MSSGTRAQECFCPRQSVKKKNEEPRSLKEIKQPLCSPVVSTAVFCLCVFKLLGLLSYQFFFFFPAKWTLAGH